MIVNALFAITLKFGHALLAFATVHALVKSWGTEHYGLWAAFISVAAYVSMFDLGIGYGMRNKVSESAGCSRLEQADATVRVATLFYAAASIVAWIAAMAVSTLVRPFSEHLLASTILWTSAVLSFFMSIHGNILQALGRFRVVAVLSVLAPLLWYLAVSFGGQNIATLESAAAVYSGTIVLQALSLAVMSRRSHRFGIFRKTPADWIEARRLVKTGLQFFLLQFSALVLLNSGNFIVYSHLGSRETTDYDVLNKIYSMFTLGFSVLVGIAWTEISKAKVARNPTSLRRIFLGLHAASILVVLAALGCAIEVGPLSLALTSVAVNTRQALPFVLLVSMQALAFSSAVFLNAFEALRPQLVGVSIGLPLFFATLVWALHAGLGIASVPLATSVAMAPSLAICFPVARRLIDVPEVPASRILSDTPLFR